LAYDRTPDNIGYNLGAFVGSAAVGAGVGRAAACRLSPPENQPLPGWKGWNPKNDVKQVWRSGGPEGKRSPFALYGDFGNAMGTGPNPLSAAGTVAAGGTGSADIYRFVK
jgi:hypothetical protein